MFLGNLAPKFTSTLFHTKKIHFSQVTMRFFTPTHIHISFTLFNTRKIGIQGNNLHIFI